MKVVVECSSCGGTGLYVGYAEAKGVAVICLFCNGAGSVDLFYTPFEKRKDLAGITTVSCSRGSFVGTGVGPIGGTVTYAEFQREKLPWPKAKLSRRSLDVHNCS